MLYAILAYHEEHVVQSWSDQEDEALMVDLQGVTDRLRDGGRLGPAARLGATQVAATLRGPGRGLVTDGPFAETKEHLLGFYVVECATRDDAIQAARDLKGKNPTAVYEIRPIVLYLPGTPFPITDAGIADVRPERV
jgi:hypothetical protein